MILVPQGTVKGSNVKGAPSPSRTMFIYRVDNDTNDDDMRAWISDHNVNIIHFERLSHVDSKYKSYKLEFQYLIICPCLNQTNGRLACVSGSFTCLNLNENSYD